MAERTVWVSWVERRQRWEVGFYWTGYKHAFRKYSWEFNGKRYPFTKENKHIANQFADYIRSLMIKDPNTGVCRFDPTKLSKQRKSKYALSRYSKMWIGDYEAKINTGDVTYDYVCLLSGYLSSHIHPILGDISLFEIDSLVIKDFYRKTSEKALTKKHVQNIMDCLRMILRSACEDIPGLDMPKFPKYREKSRIKINKFLLPEEQEKVISFIEPQHKAIAKVCFYYGLRPQEAISLRRGDLISLNDNTPALKIDTLKGGPERLIPIDPETVREIKAIKPQSIEYLIPFKGKKYSRKTIYKAFRRALDKAGFKDFRPYDATRHSRASNMALMGASAFDIQNQLGHSDIRTSQVYTHIKPSGKWIKNDKKTKNIL